MGLHSLENIAGSSLTCDITRERAIFNCLRLRQIRFTLETELSKNIREFSAGKLPVFPYACGNPFNIIFNLVN